MGKTIDNNPPYQKQGWILSLSIFIYLYNNTNEEQR